MPQVLFTMDSLYNGGTEKSLLDIASRLRDVEPVFCCFYEHRQLADAFARAGLRVHALGMRDAYGFPKAARFLAGVLEAERPGLVVGHLLRAELVTRWVCRRARLPVIGTFVNDTYSPAAYATQSASRRVKTDCFRALNRVSARWCAHFIANSAAIARSNAAALGIPAERVAVVPRGRDERVYFPPRPARTGPIRTLVSVARLLERKGQRELVRAFARIAGDFPEARLLIAGDGVFRGTLEREIARAALGDRVTLLGNVADIPALLRDADLFAFPSHYEGFSGALVEAMLTGLPIVASDIPMNLEAVEPGRTCRTFPVTDEAALADRLRWCLANPDEARAMGARARQTALERFTLDRVAAQFEEVLLELIARTSRDGAPTAARRAPGAIPPSVGALT
jgi:glycosyltransferase involved in cell wall biosynthesis